MNSIRKKTINVIYLKDITKNKIKNNQTAFALYMTGDWKVIVLVTFRQLDTHPDVS